MAEELPFKIVRTNGSDEVLARSANLLLGRAAFETAKQMYPKDTLEYRKGAQVLDRSREGDGGQPPDPPRAPRCERSRQQSHHRN